MLLKSADDRQAILATLEDLLHTPGLQKVKRELIVKEQKAIERGAEGERESAYEIDFLLKDSKNWVVLHDLRLEHKGRVAQIDHLLFSRTLDIFVVETKHFSADLQVNDRGEFTAWYGKKPLGIPSPLAQNDKHVAVVKSLLDDLVLPTRLGVTMTPVVKSLVMVSARSRITRPKSFNTDCLIKSDQLKQWLGEQDKRESTLGLLGSLARIVSLETVLSLAEQFRALHKPIVFDYRSRFGLACLNPATAELEPDSVAGAFATPAKMAGPAFKVLAVDGDVEFEGQTAEPPTPSAEPSPAERDNRRAGGYFCAKCKVSVSYAVAKFCWDRPARFGGKVYCFDHQLAVATAT
ncbi:nuclease-related domain-containing protein [Parachitinimonas caeni]|uniref:Nuclease-related domain-containing protein n=1 Tax=Parachitinimonas caeni TaxID=3031301 RepID=A0ABT7E179_9NEIS|nr:nuclease-related domain-containing protein [Parachitinimonas caeni]MDK2126077.1 nuclease-related domain-containing protein [Parachitinimonas caeni]